ncbi:hypothetical protein ACA910_009384 [Epithemia clementina (nom. ined.)]
MAAYRKKAANDRDALFGGLSDNGGGGGGRSGGSGGRPNTTTSRPTTAPPRGPPPSQQQQQQQQPDAMERLRQMKKGRGPQRPVLQGEIRETKLKEAQEYKEKANKCMQKSFFGKPDPVAASTFYKRAADCYQQLGDMGREERLYRIQSAQCNEMIGAWASVAVDYTRAADLLVQQYESGQSDPTIADPALEASSYHQKAAEAYLQMNEKSKSAGAQIKAAIALNSFGSSGSHLSKQSLMAMEEAVEAHVPDILNPFRRYRQTGKSAFADQEDEMGPGGNGRPSPQALEFAREHMVTASYAHEPLQELVYMLVNQYREYPSALYAAGAATALLEKDGHSTISITRMYLTETILLLAMGDAVAAQETFLQRHVQKTFYLNSRECQLAEELFRAILDRNPDVLEEVRSPTGNNKAALANLHPSLRQLVQELRLSGVARKQKPQAPQPQGRPVGGGGGGGTAPGGQPPVRSGSGGRGGGGRGPPPPQQQQQQRSGSKSGSKSGMPPAAAAAAAAATPQESTLSDLMNMKTGYEKEIQEGAQLEPTELLAELDNLDFGDSDNDGGVDDDDDDDDFDLR